MESVVIAQGDMHSEHGNDVADAHKKGVAEKNRPTAFEKP